MARLAFGGFDFAHEHADGLASVGTTLTFDAARTRSGRGFSAKFSLANGASSGGGQVRNTWTSTAGVTYYGRCWFYLTAYPTQPLKIGRIINQSGGVEFAWVRLNTDGTLTIYNQAGQALSTTATPLALNTWHCLEMSDVGYGVSGSGAGQGVWVQARVNGQDIGPAAAVNISSTAFVGEFRWGVSIVSGTLTAAFDVWFDDWALNDSTGAADNSWPGTDESITLLLPTADSAVSANWKLGNGTSPAGNAYDSVNNTPPTGKSASAGGDQIKNSVNDVTSPNADADLEVATYTAGGVGATDTVTNVFAVCEAAPGTAAAQSVAVAGVSNPAITEVDTNTGASAVGTYPTNWTRAATAILTPASEPAHGTAPVVRVGRRTASANALNVCAVGLYAAYVPTPTPAKSPPIVHRAHTGLTMRLPPNR